MAYFDISLLVILILRNILSFCTICGYDVDSKYRRLNVKNKLKHENNACFAARFTISGGYDDVRCD